MPVRPGLRQCVCGHLRVTHNLRLQCFGQTVNKLGLPGEPCGCKLYTEDLEYSARQDAEYK